MKENMRKQMEFLHFVRLAFFTVLKYKVIPNKIQLNESSYIQLYMHVPQKAIECDLHLWLKSAIFNLPQHYLEASLISLLWMLEIKRT